MVAKVAVEISDFFVVNNAQGRATPLSLDGQGKVGEMIPFTQMLDWQIYFKENESSEKTAPVFHYDTTGRMIGPMTLRSILSRYDAVLLQAGFRWCPDTQGAVNAANAEYTAKAAPIKPMCGRKPERFSEEEKEAIRQDFAAGMSKRSIARKYKCNERTIRRILTRA